MTFTIILDEIALYVSRKIAGSRFADTLLIILVFGLTITQFVSPLVEKNGKNITSFEGLEFTNLNWAFNYFYFIAFIVIMAIILYFLSLKKEISRWYEVSLWAMAFAGSLFFLIELQGFTKTNSSLGITLSTKNVAYSSPVISLIIIIICCVLAVGKLFNQYENAAEKTKEKTATKYFKHVIENKEIQYENTVLLNPSWYNFLNRPDPLNLVVTDEEIIISSNPVTKIPFISIKSITFNELYQSSLRINCKTGATYNIIWCPTNKAAKYDVWETKNIKENLVNILNEYTKNKI